MQEFTVEADEISEYRRRKTGLTSSLEYPLPKLMYRQFVNLARRRALEFGKTDYAEDDVLVTIHPNESAPTTRQPQRSYSSLVNAGDERGQRGFFADQFENESNFKAHYNGTGPEILRQTSGHIDAFVSGAGGSGLDAYVSLTGSGTGGTIAGTGQFLKKYKPDIKIVLSDPEGSGLYNKVRFNVMYDAKESEGTKRRWVKVECRGMNCWLTGGVGTRWTQSSRASASTGRVQYIRCKA